MARSRSDRGGPAPSSPRSDAYVGLLGISLVALIIGSVLLLLDKLEYPEGKPSGPPGQFTLLPRPEGGGAAAPVPQPDPMKDKNQPPPNP